MLKRELKLEVEKFLLGLWLLEDAMVGTMSDNSISIELSKTIEEHPYVNNAYRKAFKDSFSDEIHALNDFLTELFSENNLRFDFEIPEPKNEILMMLEGFELSENALKKIELELQENEDFNKFLTQEIEGEVNFFNKYNIKEFSKAYSLFVERYRKQIKLYTKKTTIPLEIRKQIPSYFN